MNIFKYTFVYDIRKNIFTDQQINKDNVPEVTSASASLIDSSTRKKKINKLDRKSHDLTFDLLRKRDIFPSVLTCLCQDSWTLCPGRFCPLFTVSSPTVTLSLSTLCVSSHRPRLPPSVPSVKVRSVSLLSQCVCVSVEFYFPVDGVMQPSCQSEHRQKNNTSADGVTAEGAEHLSRSHVAFRQE